MSDLENSVRETIKAWLIEQFFSGNSEGLTDETRLVSVGLIDSLSIMVLVDFLEKSFKFEFEPHEVDVDNLDTLNIMVKFVLSRIT